MPLNSLRDVPSAEEIRSRLANLRLATPVLIALYDRTDRLQYANQAFRKAFALEEDETPQWIDLIFQNMHKSRGMVIRTSDLPTWIASTKSRRGKLPYRAYELDLVDGRWLWMTETTDSDGWMLCIATDISTVRADERELRQARDYALKVSQTDDLTGIANRRFMMNALETLGNAIAAGASSGGCACLIDLDHFKKINDNFGHQIGDELLTEFARFIQGIVRRRDSFGRIGGEEFMVIFPDTTLLQATRIMDDILGRIRKASLIGSVPELSLTFSAGIAKLLPGEALSELYTRVDKALYAAKGAGRNRLEIAP